MFRLRPLRCSFCRKDESQVSKLVAGPRVYICNECVSIASQIIGNDTDHGEPAPRAGRPVWRRLLTRARKLFRNYNQTVVGSR